ncbi:MAG: hypothetical protein ABNH38_10765 [Tateyamaria sp.]|jgi:hypothetical protein|uniref:hypothetical protein n=1 Tax=Tateyamaria sp. TaxID=1929288 RepID=UPI0032DE2A5D
MNQNTCLIAAICAIALVGCSTSGSRSSAVNPTIAPAVMFSTGPIYSACRKADRKQASRSQCGCVQAVANQSLDPSDQRRGAGFFTDPQKAQDVRTSERSIDERFWLRWKAYGDKAAQICA